MSKLWTQRNHIVNIFASVWPALSRLGDCTVVLWESKACRGAGSGRFTSFANLQEDLDIREAIRDGCSSGSSLLVSHTTGVPIKNSQGIPGLFSHLLSQNYSQS